MQILPQHLMNTNSEDGGERASVFFRTSLTLILILISCNNPDREKKTFSALPLPVKDSNTVLKKDSVIIPVVKKKTKKIYLTFDDGPNRGTRNVMEVLKEDSIPATFFIVGQHVYGSKAQRMTWDSLLAMPDVELCNHSYTHAMRNHFQKFYSNPDTVVKDFQRTQDSLHLTNNIVRAPGRNCWRMDSLNYTDIKKSKTAIDSLEKAGFTVIGWDLEWHFNPQTLRVQNSADALLKQIDSVFRRGRTKIPEHLVLLAHDQVYQSKVDLSELKDLIQKLKQKDGYELALLKDYPAIKSMTDSSKSKTPLQ